jgi:transcriptional regulator with XRE-family HTH domain
MNDKDVTHHLLTILGTRIRQRRKQLGWTQEEFAHYANIDRSYMGGVERGQRNVTFTVLCKIANTLKVDVAYLTKNLPHKVDVHEFYPCDSSQ